MLKKSKTYWTKQTDQAVFDFIAEEDDFKREQIFEDHIHKPLIKLIDAMIFKVTEIKPNSIEQDLPTLRAVCLEKFFKITMPNSEYIKEEKGRPFNFLTSVMRNHLIGYSVDIYKRKKKFETNHFDNEEFVFSEKINELGEDNYHEMVLESEEVDSKIIYGKIIELINKDLKKDNFKSKKEKEFAEHLIYVMKHIDKFNEFGWYNKFFIKLILQELTCLPRYTVNYYLSKLGKRYLAQAYQE